jgi:NADH-quinone oxidoreductase subunit N
MNLIEQSFQLSSFSIELMVFALFLLLFSFELLLSFFPIATSKNVVSQLSAEKHALSILAILGLSLILGISFLIDIRCDYPSYLNDSLAIYAKRAILLCAILILLVMHQGIERFALRQGELISLYLLSLLGLLFWVSTKDLISWTIALELSSMPLVLMTAFDKQEQQVRSAFHLYLTAVLSSIVLLFALSILIGWTGESDFSKLRNQLAAAKPAMIQLALILVILSTTFKMGLFPSHRWLSDSYHWAYQGTIAYLGTLTKLVALVAIGRLVYTVFPAYLSFLEPYVFFIGVGSLIVGHFGALAQKPSRRMLAYAGIAQGALLWMALFSMNSLALGAAFYFGFAYLLAFLLILLIDMSVLKHDGDQQIGYDQLKKYPFFLFAFILAILSMAGIPPLLGFWAKFNILLGIFKGQHYLFILIALSSALISLYYYLSWVKEILVVQEVKMVEVAEIKVSTYVIAFILLFALLLLGLFPHLLLNDLQHLAQLLIKD